MLRKTFDNDLEILMKNITEMSDLVRSQFEKSMFALKNNNRELAESISERDKKVNRYHREIERTCMDLILHQQPVSRDLRTISMCMKVILDLERIGDYAGDIAQLFLTENIEVKEEDFSDIGKMYDMVLDMFDKGVDAFIRDDEELALEVKKRDDDVDALYDNYRIKIIDKIAAKPNYTQKWIEILQIAKYLERAGDHVENIAKVIIYRGE